jgi:hypothetical protein
LRRSGRACALAIAVVAAPVAAAAQSDDAGGPSVSLTLDLSVCAGPAALDPERVARILRAELAESHVALRLDAPDRAEPTATTRVRASLACDGPRATAALEVEDSATAKTVTRAVELSDVSDHLRARALALAIAELLRASWAELALETETTAEPAAIATLRSAAIARVAPVVARQTRREDRSLFAMRIAVHGRYLERFGHGLLGGSLGLDIAPEDAPLVIGLALGVDAALVDDALGTISIVHPFLDASLAFQAMLRPLAFTIGGFARGGPVALGATPRATVIAMDTVLPALFAGARAGIAIGLGARYALGVDLEIGLPIVGAYARAGGIAAAGVDGLSVSLALALTLPT